MRAKKRELEEAIMVEERRAELLEERLRERKKQCLRIQWRRQQAALEIQCSVRQRFAREKVGGMRRHQAAMYQISVFCQAWYRGSKGREIARSRRQEVVQQKRERDASIHIQCAIRAWAAQKAFRAKKDELQKGRYAGACTIQASVRRRQCRGRYLERLRERQHQLLFRQEKACTKIQSIHRRNIALEEADRRRAAKQKAAEEKPDPKPKRVPLHMRRYSTYSVAQVASLAVTTNSQRRVSVTGSVKSLTTPTFSRQQRRSSCPIVGLTATTTRSTCRPTDEVTKGVSNDTKGSGSEPDKSKSSLAQEARQRAAARVHVARRERKLRTLNNDESDKARRMRNRVASFEEKRRKLVSTKKKFSSRVKQEGGRQGGDGGDGRAITEADEERSPPQALSCDKRNACTPSTLCSAGTVQADADTPSESTPAQNMPRQGNEGHHCTHDTPSIQVDEMHGYVLASLETDFDAKFDSFSEHEDDLG